MTERAATLARWASLLALQAAVGAWAVHLGFSHVSDDDYARVVIAEQFAHAPRWDPSGTSWLPLPFWVNGTAMLLFGRSLGVASALAWVMGLLSVLVGYAGMRAASVSRTTAWLATVVVITTPWSVWLAIATIPEAPTAALVFFGAMTLSSTRWRVLGGGALAVASLCRYEAWPVCAFFAAVCSVETLRSGSSTGSRAEAGIAMGLALLGPLAWMAWNAHAHGSWFHFVTRVTAFHKSHAGDPSLEHRLLTYPLALWTSAPELSALGLVGALGGREVFGRWRRPLIAGVCLLAFLVYGDLQGGAPTHHSERALAVLWWLLAGFGLDGVHAIVVRHAWARSKREAWAVAVGVAGSIAVVSDRVARLRDYPGGGDEDRSAQVARGLAIRTDPPGELTVVPCEYEHFALLAALAAPERVRIRPPTHARVTSSCPELVKP